MTGGALFAAWFVGLLCGVALTASKAYRNALAGYVVAIAALQLLGVTGQGWLLDLLILVGAILLCFGVTRGVIELVWPERKADADNGTGTAPVQGGGKGQVQKR